MSDLLREALEGIAGRLSVADSPELIEHVVNELLALASGQGALAEYEYRAVVAKMRRWRSGWYGGQHGESTASCVLADQLGAAGLLTGWVERRVVGRPERVSRPTYYEKPPSRPWPRLPRSRDARRTTVSPGAILSGRR